MTTLKGKLYRPTVRSTLLHGVECWPIKKIYDHHMEKTEMQMLSWMCKAPGWIILEIRF